MRIKLTVAVLVVSIGLLAVWLWPYSDAFTVGYEAVTDEVVRIIEENPTHAGVEKAHKYFSSRESSLKERMDAGLKPDSRGAISETVRSRYYQALGRANNRLEKLGKEHPALEKQLDYLSSDMIRID